MRLHYEYFYQRRLNLLFLAGILVYLFFEYQNMVEYVKRYPIIKNVKNLNTDKQIKDGDIVSFVTNYVNYKKTTDETYNLSIESSLIQHSHMRCNKNINIEESRWDIVDKYTYVTPFKAGNYLVSQNLIFKTYSGSLESYIPTNGESRRIADENDFTYIGQQWFYKAKNYDVISYLKGGSFRSHRRDSYFDSYIQTNDPLVTLALNIIIYLIKIAFSEDSRPKDEYADLFRYCSHGDERLQFITFRPKEISILAQIHNTTLHSFTYNGHEHGIIMKGKVSLSKLLRPRIKRVDTVFIIAAIVITLLMTNGITDTNKEFNATLLLFTAMIYAFRSYFLNYSYYNRSLGISLLFITVFYYYYL
ncbi:hypothetical protein TVAG_466090 [Trichomonas vaginalis G3]|uniref:Uncharacterized protein n=1 Tax=Trichomonas vaginalis (strain ATCC PRA-98 / G3) TaxID=412133 RepID=A2EX90_TRIV3|nr:transmembrane protein 43 family [Trichomonas vaginalis G3]EAY02749.1 hypothetical protein TVAG_466090 [Trichomonas vaginalis G3]KAI5517250.1 transmembrane protein 43 family [Trichomonas vaginalis G3]|eukprot:XP_001314972.1 hypothetical protein [Trichomonas vaginalis G3]